MGSSSYQEQGNKKIKSNEDSLSKKGGEEQKHTKSKLDPETIKFIEEDFDKYSFNFKHVNEDVYGSGINQIKVFHHHPSRMPFDYKNK